MANDQENPYFFDEENTEILLSREDLENVRDFYKIFKIDTNKYLDEVFDTCISDFSKFDKKMQLRLRLGLAHTIAHSDHPLYGLEVFKQVKPNVKAEVSDPLEARFLLEQELEDLVK